MPKKIRPTRLYGIVRGKLESNVRTSRRETIYKMTCKKNGGKCPCYVCGLHVDPDDATLEHKLPKSTGGTDSMSNLAISHGRCNWTRGNK